MELIFHPDVHPEIDDAYRWYEEKRFGLGENFLAALDEVFERLKSNPEACQIIYRDVRRAMPRRFPYSIFYRIRQEHAEIVAVRHSHRDDAGWKSRI